MAVPTAAGGMPVATGTPAAGAQVAARRRGLRSALNLTLELGVTQFKLKYTGSVLGYVWSLLKPLMIFAIMYVVFADLLHAGRGQPNFVMQLLFGIVLWNFFGEATAMAQNAVVSNGHLLKKASFPRPVLIVAATLTATMTFVINVVLIIVIAGALHQLDLRPSSVVGLLIIAEMYLFIIGLGLILSALFVTFRDLGHIWEIMLQALFYASAVVYPISIVHRWKTIVALNPVAQMINDLRHYLVARQVPSTASFLGARMVIPVGLVIASVLVGGLAFRRLAPRFAEYL